MAIGETLAVLSSSKALIPRFFTSSSSASPRPRSVRLACRSSSPPAIGISDTEAVRRMVKAFNPKIPLAEALTPPSSWYTEPSFLALEYERVFFRGWQAVGYTEQIKNPHDFFTGRKKGVRSMITHIWAST